MHYSFVVPIYNDGDLAPAFCAELETVLTQYLGQGIQSQEIEVLFIEDGSVNNSFEVLQTIAQQHDFIKIIRLSRNFGHHIALSCGYAHAIGKYVVMLNVDRQDPLDQIPLLLDLIQNSDYDIVYGLRDRRQDSIRSRITTYGFHSLFNFLTGSKAPLNIATLRVMNRKFIDAYNSLSEKTRYIPGLEDWLGFKHGYVKTRHQARAEGKSSYNFKRRFALAFNSIISFSDFPLKVIALFGMSVAFVGFLLTLYLVVTKLLLVNYQAGFTSTVSIITLLGGIQILVTGLAALYIGRILKEVQNRPLFIIRDKINFEKS